VKAAYSYGEAKNTVDPGSIAFGSWNQQPARRRSEQPRPRLLASPRRATGSSLAGCRTRRVLQLRPTTFSLFWDSFTGGNTSYIFAGDLNGDGGTSNDLIYIPRDQSEMNFLQYTTGGGRSRRRSRPRPGTPTSSRTTT
jgi:hypothetical protein